MTRINPPVKLDHLKALTDDTGILQHAKYTIPNRKEGYTTDDNARALIVCGKFLQLYGNFEVEQLANTYLSFLFHMQRSDGRFHNLLSYDRDFLDDVGSEECMGRALWACGCVLPTNLSKGLKTNAKEVFDIGFQHTSTFKSLRAKAFTILGLCAYYAAFPHDPNLSVNVTLFAEQLLDIYRHTSSPNWSWFEPYLTYANARLSQALFQAYTVIGDERYLQIAKESFDYLVKVQVINQTFVPIGNKGWYPKGGRRAIYDQQPIEASSMVEGALTAYHATAIPKYQQVAQIAFNWFSGKNTQNVQVYDPTTGACNDGISPQGLNLNQGAEATLSYLLARLQLENVRIK